MNRIVALTDFSPAADNALHYAAQLANLTGSELTLLYVYQIPITMSDMPVIMVSAEELKRNADENLSRSKEAITRDFPGLQVKVESRIGDVVDELNEWSKEAPVFAVVMGKRNYSGLERALFGNTNVSVIRNTKTPVFVVPDGFKGTEIRNAVIACDLDDKNVIPADRIIEILRQLNSLVHIVHVCKDDSKEVPPQELMNSLAPLDPDYYCVHDEDVTKGIQCFVDKVRADLLVVMPHQHSWMESFFFKLHTKNLIQHIQIPILSIPN